MCCGSERHNDQFENSPDRHYITLTRLKPEGWVTKTQHSATDLLTEKVQSQFLTKPLCVDDGSCTACTPELPGVMVTVPELAATIPCCGHRESVMVLKTATGPQRVRYFPSDLDRNDTLGWRLMFRRIYQLLMNDSSM